MERPWNGPVPLTLLVSAVSDENWTREPMRDFASTSHVEDRVANGSPNAGRRILLELLYL